MYTKCVFSQTKSEGWNTICDYLRHVFVIGNIQTTSRLSEINTDCWDDSLEFECYRRACWILYFYFYCGVHAKLEKILKNSLESGIELIWSGIKGKYSIELFLAFWTHNQFIQEVRFWKKGRNANGKENKLMLLTNSKTQFV